MEQQVQCTIDTPLLQRVSKVREHMGLEALPTEILVSELDPFLLHLVRKESDDDPALAANLILEDQQKYWSSFNKKWNTWFDWI